MNAEPNPRDALAARMFPAAWARVATVPGKSASKRRQQLRRDAEKAAKVPLHARCGNCGAFEPSAGKGSWCGRDSDFHGTVFVAADRRPCFEWRAQEPGQ